MSRTYTPSQRSARPPGPSGNFTATDVDTNLLGIAAVTNAAAVVKLVANQTARLALGLDVQVGDHCLQLDTGVEYTLKALPPSTSGNWQGPTGLTNPMTHKGDMIAGGASGAVARVPYGTTGQVPTIQGDGSVAFATPAGGSPIPPWIDPSPLTPPAYADFTSESIYGTFGPLPVGGSGAGLQATGGGGGSVSQGWCIADQAYDNVSNRAALVYYLLIGTDCYAGLILREAGSGKFVFFGIYWAGSTGGPVFRCEKFNADGTSAGTLATDVNMIFNGMGLLQLRLANGGGSIFQFDAGSGCGEAQIVFDAIDISSFVTPDMVGFACSNSSNDSPPGNGYKRTILNLVNWNQL